MRIVVTIKQVPDPDIPPAQFRIDEASARVVPPPGVSPVMNGYDANALEAALRLKEAHGGRVVALSLGRTETRDTLKRAIAMGADEAVLLEDPALADADSWLTAAALAAAIRKLAEAGEPIDLVLCGRQASDTDAAQVPYGIAEMLGWPIVAPTQRIEWNAGAIRAERLTADGYEVIEITSPVVLAISSEVYEPRYPPLRGVMMAGRAQIPVWSSADLGLDETAPRRRLKRLYREVREARVELIEADSPAEAGRRLADRLREARLI